MALRQLPRAMMGGHSPAESTASAYSGLIAPRCRCGVSGGTGVRTGREWMMCGRRCGHRAARRAGASRSCTDSVAIIASCRSRQAAVSISRSAAHRRCILRDMMGVADTMSTAERAPCTVRGAVVFVGWCVCVRVVMCVWVCECVGEKVCVWRRLRCGHRRARIQPCCAGV